MNFTAVAFLDTFDLVSSLPKRMGMFKAIEGATAPKLLPLRGPRAGGDPEDDLGFVNYATAARWPEMQSMLKRIKRLGDQIGGIEFGRIYLELIPPVAPPVWEPPEGGEYSRRYSRSHLALRTNPMAVVYSGIEVMHLPVGVLTLVDRRGPTSALNMGEHPRIHLILDSRKKDQADEV